MRIPAKGKEGTKAEKDHKVELTIAESGRMRAQGLKPTIAFYDLSCRKKWKQMKEKVIQGYQGWETGPEL